MADAAAVFATLRAVLEASPPVDMRMGALALLWQHEQNQIPQAPSPFIYSELVTSRGHIASYGGGRGQNRYRVPAEFNCFVFVPAGQGVAVSLALAEQAAALFRSFRSGDVSCVDATVMPVGEGADLVPPGLQSQASNYACAVATVSLFFDQAG